MLYLKIPAKEGWDSVKNEFVQLTPEYNIQLEHSLVSLSKWEAKWKKPFLSKTPPTVEETIDYIRCMTITQNVDPIIYTNLDNSSIQKVNEYIGDPMTATKIYDEKKSNRKGEQITSELIYYWMIALNIPPEYQKWHLNRLMTLIRVCNIKNQPPKKHTRKELTSRNAALNAARRKQLGTKG